MKKITAQDAETRSPDLVADNIDQIRALFPEAFTEGKIDFDVLKQLLGDAVDDREEKYGLNWYGKRRARQIALSPSTGTLRPCPEDSSDWKTTQNLMIEGDNLEVLKLLQKSYSGKIKLIYIDPPYNTGNDFVYSDDYRDNINNYLAITHQLDGDGRRVSSNSEASGRFHTDWLNMMYPRIRLSRNLLQDDGIICISIDDNEQANLRKLCDEVYGEENHLATIVWQKRYVSNVTAQWLSDMHDFILVYAKNCDRVRVNSWERTEEQLEAYKNPDNDPRGVWRAQDLSASKPYSAGRFTIEGPTGLRFDPPPNRYWRCNYAQFKAWRDDNRIWWGVNGDARPMLKSFLAETERGITPHTWWEHEFAGHNKEATLELKALFGGDAPFDTPKPVKLMRRLIDLFCRDKDIILDFFAGSAPVGHAAMALNAAKGWALRFILVQFPEHTGRQDYILISDIAKERLRRAGKKISEENPTTLVDLGFRVFKLASSNIQMWESKHDDLPKTLQESIDHLKTDRTESDILYEVLLKLGLDLTVSIEEKKIAGKAVYSIGAGTLIICLTAHLAATEVESLALGIVGWHKELAPAGETNIVFRDSAFANDVAKTNLAAILQQHGLGNVRSL